MPYKDKEIGKAHMKAYFELHPEVRERAKQRKKKWDFEHQEEIKQERAREYQSLTLQQKLERQDKALERNRQIRLEVLRYYGNGQLACSQCSEKRIECLSIDHINGNGSAHRKTLGGDNIFRWLKRNSYPLGFRTLCMNCQFCNWKRRKIWNKQILAVQTK